ncbi:hypothetical protein Avbf_06699, partial [Armadillidium vulgare]
GSSQNFLIYSEILLNMEIKHKSPHEENKKIKHKSPHEDFEDCKSVDFEDCKPVTNYVENDTKSNMILRISEHNRKIKEEDGAFEDLPKEEVELDEKDDNLDLLNNNKSFKCPDVCDNTTNDKHILKQHMSIHPKIKFNCNYCDYS